MKAPFKKIATRVLVIFSFFISITYISCNRDRCKTIVCAYGGVCNDGVCVCPSGYEGSNCETVSRDKFLGNWNVLEKGTNTKAAQYVVSIQKSTQTTDVVISNFNNYFHTLIKGYVIHDTLFVPNQEYEGKVVFGIGYMYSSVTYGQFGAITMRYEVVDSITQLVDDYGYYAPDLSDPSAWNK